jgi:hypothetical protein
LAQRFQHRAIGTIWRGRVDAQQIVTDSPWVNVKVQVWDFLIRAGSCRVPDRQPIRGNDRVYGARDSGHGYQNGGREAFVHKANVRDMLSRYDENVAGLELPEIEKSHGVIVGSNDGRRRATGDDVAEGADVSATLITHRRDHSVKGADVRS